MTMSLFALAVGIYAAVEIEPLIQSARADIARPTQAQLGFVRQQIKLVEEDLPTLEDVMAQRVLAENDGLKREMANLKKGVTSEAEVISTRQRLLAAQAEALKTVGEARATLNKLRREEADLETRHRHALSAAPALAGK
jgi:septal ring factor EnvC (AmiA/AmiB activator)